MRKKYFDGPPTPSTHPKILAKNMYLNIKTCFKVVVDSYLGGGGSFAKTISLSLSRLWTGVSSTDLIWYSTGYCAWGCSEIVSYFNIWDPSPYIILRHLFNTLSG